MTQLYDIYKKLYRQVESKRIENIYHANNQRQAREAILISSKLRSQETYQRQRDILIKWSIHQEHVDILGMYSENKRAGKTESKTDRTKGKETNSQL